MFCLRERNPHCGFNFSILVYPNSGPGAVNISNNDLKRLAPSEFLNDTLIELGLKYVYRIAFIY